MSSTKRSAEARKDNLKLRQYLVLSLKAYGYPRVVASHSRALEGPQLDEASGFDRLPMEHWKVNAIYAILVSAGRDQEGIFEGVFFGAGSQITKNRGNLGTASVSYITPRRRCMSEQPVGDLPALTRAVEPGSIKASPRWT